MNTLFASRSIRWFLLFALAVGLMPLFAPAAWAMDSHVVASGPLQANFIFDLVADRAHMIQVTVVFVALGIALLWWKG